VGGDSAAPRFYNHVLVHSKCLLASVRPVSPPLIAIVDDDSRVGVLEELQAGQHVVGGRSKRILVNPTVHLLAHQLFGGGVGPSAYGHVGRGDADVIEWSGDTEVREKNRPIIGVEIGHDDVGWLYISVQQTLPMGVIQRAGDSGNDRDRELDGHACRVAPLNQVRCVDAVDVVHRDPQLAVLVSSVMYPHDVGMP
jgi:hypothetical protein